jgi:energy-coupling factor transporter ATP-binding protein EcfA2
MNRVEKRGDVCWSFDFADRMLSPVAQVNVELRDWFLATHSPVVVEEDAGTITERDLLERLFLSTRPETLVMITGSQGTGKSQLINWLKIGFDRKSERGEQSGAGDFRVRSVLVRRGAGSLKDALEQLVEQLPVQYRRHLSRIQSAISGITGEQARMRLYTEMKNSLYAVQKRVGLRGALGHLHEVFSDNGTVDWLCREGGAIDLNIKRLTDRSEAEARESLPPFRAEDFEFPRAARTNFDEDLKLRLEDDEEIRAQCAAAANESLRLAVAGLTGLRGDTLNEIFRAIRVEMLAQREMLALFIEDVSTLSVLDAELVNAFQPQNDRSLCPLVAVLGMTEGAYKQLPDNLKERSKRVTLQQDSSFRNGLDDSNLVSQAIDRFVARYLNAIRLEESGLAAVVDGIVATGMPGKSACMDCPLAENCFEAFGAVEFGEVKVGLFPLSAGASYRLLDGLSNTAQPRTPRALLQQVVLPLLSRVPHGFQGGSVGLAVQPRLPRDLSEQRDQLLAGWTDEERNRLAFLLYYWTGEESLDSGAATLQPILSWLRQREFSKGGRVNPVKVKPPIAPPGKERQSVVPPPAPTREYDDAITRITAWHTQGKTLERDKDFRDLLLKLVKESLDLDNVRTPAQATRRRSGMVDASNIEIEGMRSRPAFRSKARFVFERSGSTFELLKDLVDFEFLGRKSWDFPGGAEARQRYGEWLRANSGRLLDGYNVLICDREAALRYGTHFLILAYRFAERKSLPSDTAAAVECLMEFKPEAPITAISERARRLAEDLPQRVESVRSELVGELAVRQGAGGINYIDPRIIIDCLGSDSEETKLGEINVVPTQGDFPKIGGLANANIGWSTFGEVLGEEHVALVSALEACEQQLGHWSLSGEYLSDKVAEFLLGARAVVKACSASKQPTGNPELEKRIADLQPKKQQEIVAVFERAQRATNNRPVALLSLDMRAVSDALDLVGAIHTLIRDVERQLSEVLNEAISPADVATERLRAIQALEQLIQLGSETTKAESENDGD